jgi:hypothetical protein
LIPAVKNSKTNMKYYIDTILAGSTKKTKY